MAKYEIMYDVEIDSDNPHEAVFWLERVLRNPEINLPDHVYWVRTVPQVTEATEPPKASPKPKAKTKESSDVSNQV